MAKKLAKLSIYTVKDLIYFFPYRHRNYSLTVPINSVQEGETVTVEGEIKTVVNSYTRSGKSIQKAKISDKSGSLNVVWFNQPYLKETLEGKNKLHLSGKVRRYKNELSLVSPDYEINQVKANPRYHSLHTGRLVPLYHSSPLVSSKYLRRVIATALPEVKERIEEFLPVKILIKNRLIPEKEAIEKIHFPENKAAVKAAKKRLSFDEMFFIQLKAARKKLSWQQEKKAAQIGLKPKQIKDFISQLPFKLTKAQKRVIREINQDLGKDTPMNRLLQGDVGSGKTVIAAFVIYSCFIKKKTAAIMAPTQILAFQHYQTLKKLLSPWKIKIELVSGGSKRKKDNYNYDLLVGTHALLHRPENFQNCGAVIIDEQHRFGVAQRSKLLRKAGGEKLSPHLLTMTATPIPRTITLTLYGDLDLSFLDEMPPGRKKIVTFIVPADKRKEAYRWIKEQIRQKGVQSFIVCPFVEESETLSSVKAAKVEFEKLQKKVFSDLNLDLLHGRMKIKEKEATLQKMQKGKIDILVSTPVVEVGIDIPNATIMVIEGAERFGLAQLHQLRGRIGRGSEKSYCFLFTESQHNKAIKRLKALESINNGMKLAEIDLKIRGPGEIYGLKQHGFPKLKIASYTDLETISKAREAAEQIIREDPALKHHPKLKQMLSEKENLVAPN
jgi:ATP-dependent DNA helicase RecG